ncbi:uncharacterized protein B0P05DRAFT_536870 [Gilbertella persicaria]|uniref:uncharacterized protein n=1 Tax=Gilbertella persicaria TaxID=101096 RepID=UPI00221EE95F|nr:uncharacterized protein B0P05DRAFT_536870 [Gilbertella persicaria]KAI8083309.1 hypothetical protein B0P05DRAFT_536870 [Gilbertella persicaria]
MKSAILGFIVAFAATASAQSASEVSTTAAAATTTSDVPTATSTSSCALQSTLDLCLQNEDNYIKTCQAQDFACLCRWNKEKLSCYSSCPNDLGAGAQKALVENYCSMPGANVSVAPWTSSVAPTSTAILSSSAAASSTAASVSPAPSTAKSAAATLAVGQGALAVAGAVAAYMLF